MVEYFQDVADEWRFTIKGANGEIVATSEGYTRSADAVRGFNTLKRLINEENDDAGLHGAGDRENLSKEAGAAAEPLGRDDGSIEHGGQQVGGRAPGEPVERAGE